MAYVPSAVAAPELRRRTFSPPRRSLWRRIFEAMIEARRSQAEREIAFYLEKTGGRFTDEIEREIESRFLTAPHR
jgi:hypothetical protein